MRKFSIFKFWSLKWQIDPKFGIYKKYKQENDWFKQKKMSFEKKSIMDQRRSMPINSSSLKREREWEGVKTEKYYFKIVLSV